MHRQAGGHVELLRGLVALEASVAGNRACLGAQRVHLAGVEGLVRRGGLERLLERRRIVATDDPAGATGRLL